MTRQPMTPLIAESARAQRLADWRARFERADCRGRPGWKCPACGDVEPNDLLLASNHGYHLDDPHVPYLVDVAEFGKTCIKLELQAAHRLYDSRRAMVRHLAGQGLDDEQIAAQVGFWDAATIAGFRKDDARAARLAAKAAKGETVTVGHGSECPCAYCGGPCTCPSCQEFRGITVPAEAEPLTLF